jgi:hypothetical protein
VDEARAPGHRRVEVPADTADADATHVVARDEDE